MRGMRIKKLARTYIQIKAVAEDIHKALYATACDVGYHVCPQDFMYCRSFLIQTFLNVIMMTKLAIQRDLSWSFLASVLPPFATLFFAHLSSCCNIF